MDEIKDTYTAKEYILYKLDRTLAIGGIVIIALAAMALLVPEMAAQIALAGLSGLVGYVGGRTGK